MTIIIQNFFSSIILLYIPITVSYFLLRNYLTHNSVSIKLFLNTIGFISFYLIIGVVLINSLGIFEKKGYIYLFLIFFTVHLLYHSLCFLGFKLGHFEKFGFNTLFFIFIWFCFSSLKEIIIFLMRP